MGDVPVKSRLAPLHTDKLGEMAARVPALAHLTRADGPPVAPAPASLGHHWEIVGPLQDPSSLLAHRLANEL